MPLAVLKHKPGLNRHTRMVIGHLALALPEMVAKALSIDGNPEAVVEPEEVEVWVTHGSDDDFYTKDIAILIWANEYPERRANLDERRDRILEDVRGHLKRYDCGKVSGYVWVLLQPASYGEL